MLRNPVLVALLLLTALCAACGGGEPPTAASSSAPGTSPSPDSSPSPAAGSGGKVVALELRRTGGIGGFDDTLVVSTDGTVELSTKDGRRSRCRLGSAERQRVRGIDWSGLPSAQSSPGHSDVMTFVVRAEGHRAVLDADTPGPEQQAAVATVAALFSAASVARSGDGSAGCKPLS